MPQVISEKIKAAVKSDGYKVTRSDSGKAVLQFEASQIAQPLWDYLQTHPSIRIVFNALVKTGGKLDPSETQRKLPDLLKEAETSFLYEVKCKGQNCDNTLDKPNLVDRNFLLPENHHITCSMCNHQNSIKRTDYHPIYEPTLDAVIKCFLLGCKKQVFSPANSQRCLICGDIAPLGTKVSSSMTCRKCKVPLLVSTEFVPIDPILRELIREKQGIWLEWYVWRMTKKEYTSEPGVIFNRDGEKIEADVVLKKENQLIVIECKDTSDSEFIVKLEAISKIADKYILITTTKLKPGVRPTIERLLKKKCVIIPSKEIENLPAILKTCAN